MLKKNKTAFTLAEILLTLGIIGIVSAIVVPIIIANSQTTAFSSKLQKTFNTISSGIKMQMLKTGCSDVVCTGILGSGANSFILNMANANVFSVIKTCNVTEKGCYDKLVKYLNNVSAWVTSDYYALMVLSDGTVWGTAGVVTACNANNGSGRLANSCTLHTTFIDVNGEQPPNKFGKDIFRFYLLKDGSVLPAGTDNDTRINYWNQTTSYQKCLTGGNGESCAARVIQEGTINY